MTEQNRHSDNSALTQKEINQLVQRTEIAFRLTAAVLLSNENKIVSRLRETIATKKPLSFATLAIVVDILEIAKKGIDTARSRGGLKIASAAEQAIDGGMFLVGQIGIGEEYSLGSQGNVLAKIFDQMTEERQTLSNSQIPLSEQARQYLDMERRARELGAQYREDPSGFAIINDTIKKLQNPLFDPRTIIPDGFTPQDFVICGIRETADFYQKVYLLGHRASLGPKPKNLN